jgi:hypothetical protein
MEFLAQACAVKALAFRKATIAAILLSGRQRANIPKDRGDRAGRPLRCRCKAFRLSDIVAGAVAASAFWFIVRPDKARRSAQTTA